MVRNGQRRGRAEVFVLIVLLLTGAAGAAERASILVEVETAGPSDVRALSRMGLDVWEVRDDRIVAVMTRDQLTRIEKLGFANTILQPDVYEHLKTGVTKEIAVTADPNETQSRYHSYEEIVQALYELVPSGIVHIESIGQSVEGRDIIAVKISDHPDVNESEPELLFVGCHHAREWIAAEIPLYLAQTLVGDYSESPEIQRWVDGCEIWIVPVVNPDGHEYSRSTDRLWRKNRRDNGDGTFGVDLSRNYGYMWGREGSSSDPESPLYRGTGAFSEPESRAVRDLVLRCDFQTFVTFHSYAQLVIYPWGYTTEESPDHCLLTGMAEDMAALISDAGGREYDPLMLARWYLVSGAEMDWTYGRCGIPSFGIEVRPTWYDQGGFLLPESEIVPTCAENLAAAFYLMAWSVGYGAVENVTASRQYRHIQSAVCDAADGDEIVVHEGLYPEHINFRGKSLTVRSTDPNDPNVVAATVITGCRRAPVVAFSTSEDETSVLNGLTITGPTVGVYCDAAVPTLQNCTIDSNGPALQVWYGYDPRQPNVIDCNIVGPVELHDPKIAHWTFDEIDGTIARDSVAGNDASLLGDPVWRPEEGRIDGALELDGMDDGAESDFVLDPFVTPYSFFAWIRGGAPGQVILSQAYGDNWLTIDPFAGYLASEIETVRRPYGLTSQTLVTDGEWHHVGLTWDESGTRSLYVDKVEVARETDVQPWASWWTDGGVRIGAPRRLVSPTYFSGLIDDVRIYNRTVTPE